MKRHPINVFSLVFGVILILLSVWIAFPRRGEIYNMPQWLVPAVLILIGGALISSMFLMRGRREESGADADVAEDGRGKAEGSEDALSSSRVSEQS